MRKFCLESGLSEPTEKSINETFSHQVNYARRKFKRGKITDSISGVQGEVQQEMDDESFSQSQCPENSTGQHMNWLPSAALVVRLMISQLGQSCRQLDSSNGVPVDLCTIVDFRWKARLIHSCEDLISRTMVKGKSTNFWIWEEWGRQIQNLFAKKIVSCLEIELFN